MVLTCSTACELSLPLMICSTQTRGKFSCVFQLQLSLCRVADTVLRQVCRLAKALVQLPSACTRSVFIKFQMFSFKIYGIWPQTSIATHTLLQCSQLVWGSLRLTPIIVAKDFRFCTTDCVFCNVIGREKFFSRKLMKPEESVKRHQTFSLWVGYGHETISKWATLNNLVLLSQSGCRFVTTKSSNLSNI